MGQRRKVPEHPEKTEGRQALQARRQAVPEPEKTERPEVLQARQRKTGRLEEVRIREDAERLEEVRARRGMKRLRVLLAQKEAGHQVLRGREETGRQGIFPVQEETGCQGAFPVREEKAEQPAGLQVREEKTEHQAETEQPAAVLDRREKPKRQAASPGLHKETEKHKILPRRIIAENIFPTMGRGLFRKAAASNVTVCRLSKTGGEWQGRQRQAALFAVCAHREAWRKPKTRGQ